MSNTTISLVDVQHDVGGDPGESVRLVTSRGTIACRYHPADGGDAAVLWVFGAGGGLGGPAGGIYTRLGTRLTARGTASLELAYRQPGRLTECVLDVLIGLAWLKASGRTRVILVGHSFGSAVVLNAAAASPAVIAVAALSSQTPGVGDIARLSPRPLFFAHGEADEILPPACSRQLHARAAEPKRLVLYPGCLHGLDHCREQLDIDLTSWIEECFALEASR